MHPILLTWRGVHLHSYQAMVYVGLIAGIAVGNVAANLVGLDSARVFVATLLLLAPALVGAKLLFVASHWKEYQGRCPTIWSLRDGGSSNLGGVTLVLLLSYPLLGALGLPFGAFWDVATFTALVALMFGRIGCLLHGCCSGRPSDGPFTLYLPDHRGVWRRRIPSQLLDMGLCFSLLVAATMLWPSRAFPGAIALIVLAGYGSGRLVLEATREERSYIRSLNVHRTLSASIAVIAFAALIAFWIEG
jgi:phosphatidylglycerol:prolipoprotein diacylglycerol transferase